MSIFLGIDVGTSGTKTIAIDERGKILASATADYPLYTPKPLWSEQNPDDWWKATVATIRAVVKKAKLKPADVKGIGLSGQMHGSVFLDKQNRVIRRAILWNDQRTGPECLEIERLAGGRKNLIKMVANPALTGFTAPKILWLRNHEPKNFEKLAKVLLPKDEILRRLTGEFCNRSKRCQRNVALGCSQAHLVEGVALEARIGQRPVGEMLRVGGGHWETYQGSGGRTGTNE
jgi:xylulokinase